MHQLNAKFSYSTEQLDLHIYRVEIPLYITEQLNTKRVAKYSDSIKS